MILIINNYKSSFFSLYSCLLRMSLLCFHGFSIPTKDILYFHTFSLLFTFFLHISSSPISSYNASCSLTFSQWLKQDSCQGVNIFFLIQDKVQVGNTIPSSRLFLFTLYFGVLLVWLVLGGKPFLLSTAVEPIKEKKSNV